MSDPQEASLESESVLVVEDSRSVAGLIAGRIEDELGLRVEIAGSRGAAQRLLRDHAKRFVAAVLDLNLPDAPDGEVVADVVGERVPAIVLTATIEDDLRDRLLRVGVCDYVVKETPDAIDSVLLAVHRLRRNRSIGVLVVDDSRSARDYLTELLRRWGYRCEQAANGEEALERMSLADGSIGLVLCDQNMPGMDGITLIRQLRRRYPLNQLGIIGVSSHGSGLLSARLLKAGANDFLTRPFLEEELSVRVNQNVDLLELLRNAEEIARRDPLTGLHNRRYLDEFAPTLKEAAQRSEQPLAAVVVDLDRFKKINDEAGHFAGDAVLCAVAERLKETVRGADLLVRSGGEEFYIVCIGLDEEGAAVLGERLRLAVETVKVDHHGVELAVAASVGVASEHGVAVEHLLDAADRAMYCAKRAGRNRVVRASECED